MARLRFEKCELTEAREAYEVAYLRSMRALGKSFGESWSSNKAAFQDRSLSSTGSVDLIRCFSELSESVAGLLRMASEAQDETALFRWEAELLLLMKKHPEFVSPLAWHCLGVVAHSRGEQRIAQNHFYQFLRSTRSEMGRSGAFRKNPSENWVKAWLDLAILWLSQGKRRRARWVCHSVMARLREWEQVAVNQGASDSEGKLTRGAIAILRGQFELTLATIFEKNGDEQQALYHLRAAHSIFLGQHHWYYHLYVLYAYARFARLREDREQAFWYLDLLDRATMDPAFGKLRKEVLKERAILESEVDDLWIDPRRVTIGTRERGEINLRKQYVLLNILEALYEAYSREGQDETRGLSKAELIERVWKEKYRPAVHDNKLYYNINRLRKLIEPDIRNPKYLQNWREGYRLSPSLRVTIQQAGV